MKEKAILKTKTPADYIGYAFYAFSGLGMELLIMMVETNLYGQDPETWSAVKQVIHWITTCFLWGCFGAALVKRLPEIPNIRAKRNDLIAVIIIMSLSIIYTSFAWNGLKPLMELSHLGFGRFLVQYMYYGFESLLVLLIIAYGQEALEGWFGTIKFLPFGGIFLAGTWGLVHIFSQGLSTGIFSLIQSLLFGSVYMILHKNFKISYIVIALMFMI